MYTLAYYMYIHVSLYMQLCWIHLSLLYIITAIDCGDLKNPVGGTVVVTNTRFDSVATYNCARGKDRVGVATRTCQADGTWSDQEPQCVLSKCVYACNISMIYFSVCVYDCVY